MQYKVIAPDKLATTVQLPASKSISNRVLIIRALAQGQQPLANLSTCDDTRVLRRALDKNPRRINIQAAGTAMRFLTAYLSVTAGDHTLTGSERMRHRPIRILVDALRTLGADIRYLADEGYPPLAISGRPLTGRSVTLQGNVSSQYISALLMIAPVLPDGLALHLEGDIISRPYINLTLDLMREFGAKAEWTSASDIRVEAGGYADHPFTIEADWSASSYWYEMAALLYDDELYSYDILLKGLFTPSSQGDSRVQHIYARLGVQTTVTPEGHRLTRGEHPAGQLTEDLSDIPDLAQTLVVTCALMGIPFRFTGLSSLLIKETDRMAALTTELRKLGYAIQNDHHAAMWWDGTRVPPEDDPVIATYDDHRMAMAFAPVSLLRPSILIDHPEVVTKSYPQYWRHLRRARFQVKQTPES